MIPENLPIKTSGGIWKGKNCPGIDVYFHVHVQGLRFLVVKKYGHYW